MSETERLKEEVKKQIVIMRKDIRKKDKLINDLIEILENTDNN